MQAVSNLIYRACCPYLKVSVSKLAAPNQGYKARNEKLTIFVNNYDLCFAKRMQNRRTRTFRRRTFSNESVKSTKIQVFNTDAARKSHN